jgi:HEAT repeat protein
VPAVAGAPAACCWQGWSGAAQRMACKLDERSDGFHTRDRETTESVKVYARVTGGKLDRLRALAADCPVESKTPIQELTGVSADDSAGWLVAQLKQIGADMTARHSLTEQSLAALAMHRGDLAGKALGEFAHDPRTETRKQAVFWLSLMRGAEGAAVTRSVMFEDRDPDVRQHAAFASTLWKSARPAADLIRLGTTDKVGEVRGQAWFWLAQTGAAEAEQALASALRKDADDSVREKAIFALSQLPDERATRALISVAEDRSLSKEQRRKAVFWLSQSGSDSAQAYLEKVLASY